MNYQEAIGYLFNALPMYQRIGAAAYKADLKNAEILDEYFDRPHRNFKSIHIAGTNGKGSVSHILAAVLQLAGYKTGLYTSPHLIDFRERIKINGECISQEFVTAFTKKNIEIFKEIQASFFEMTVFMAFDYFAHNHVDIAIIEVGLGGRLDTTNIIMPEISVITNIGKDHTQFLGNTLAEIAMEKAGIIKENRPVIIGETQKEITDVFNSVTKRKKCKIYYADQYYHINYSLKNLDNTVEHHFSKSHHWMMDKLNTDLQGNYQRSNIIASLMALSVIDKLGIHIDAVKMKSAFRQIKKITGLMGRWQEVDHNPLILCDIAHNTEGIKKVLEQIREMPHYKLHMVLGFVSDKNIEAILNMLFKDAEYYLCEPSIPRAFKIEHLSDLFRQKKLTFKSFRNVSDAYKSAKDNASENDMIYIGGSTFVVADFMGMKKN